MRRSTTAALVLASVALSVPRAHRAEAEGDPAAPAAPAAARRLEIGDVDLKVALVSDPDFPPLDDKLVARSLESAAGTFAERFGASPPRFEVKGSFTVAQFQAKYGLNNNTRCEQLYATRYRGGGSAELVAHRAAAVRFFEKWPLESLIGFIEEKDRANIKSHQDVYEVYARRYVRTVDTIRAFKTPRGTPLIAPETSLQRSFASWACALGEESDYDIIITNTIILADGLTEPQPHSVFGKAKIGGIATPNPRRTALGGQALLVSTFSIDTPIPMLSELGGKPASFEERADMLGSYLLAHEIAHAVFGIPDAFDHPPGCLMTSRPGETYREGLAVLHANPGACPRCRPYVEARAAIEEGKGLVETAPKDALRVLGRAAKMTPKSLHGGYKRRMSEISLLVARAFLASGNTNQAMSYARNAITLDSRALEAKKLVDTIGSLQVQLASTERVLPGIATATTARTSTAAR